MWPKLREHFESVVYDPSFAHKFDHVVLCLQCYIFRKRQPVPLELEHLVADTLEPLRPDLPLYSTAQEAYEAAAELEKKYKDKIGEGGGLSFFLSVLKFLLWCVWCVRKCG